jgi:hypothetical protein
LPSGIWIIPHISDAEIHCREARFLRRMVMARGNKEKEFTMGRLSGSVFLGLALGAAVACGQEVPPYDGLRAGEDAYQAADQQRRKRLDDQLFINNAMRASYGGLPARGSVTWYGNAGLGYSRPLGIDYAYAYSSERLLGWRGRSLYIERYWSPPLSVFEPWPYVPGDIYGYYFPPYVRQPIGQRQIQTGPTRWESHPVYPEDLEPVAPESLSAEPALVDAPATEPPPVAEPPVKKPRRRAF